MDPKKRISARAAMKHEYFCDLPTKIHELPDGMTICLTLSVFALENFEGMLHLVQQAYVFVKFW